MANRAVINPGATLPHQLPVFTLPNLKAPHSGNSPRDKRSVTAKLWTTFTTTLGSHRYSRSAQPLKRPVTFTAPTHTPRTCWASLALSHTTS